MVAIVVGAAPRSFLGVGLPGLPTSTASSPGASTRAISMAHAGGGHGLHPRAGADQAGMVVVLQPVDEQDSSPSFWKPTARVSGQACEPGVDGCQPVCRIAEVRVVTASGEHDRLPGRVSASCG
jgi:hypothetical protein